jgi:hypothetical protein
MLRRWKYHHSIQQNNISWFLVIVLVKDKHYSDLWPLKGKEVSYFNKLHICSKNVDNVSLKPYLSPDTTSPLRTCLFRCSLVRFTIKNTIYSVILRLLASVFRLLFRYFILFAILVKSAGYFLTGNVILQNCNSILEVHIFGSVHAT